MTKVIKVIALGSLIASSYTYAVSTAACAGCHGQYFEKKAMGKSKVVKDMSKEDIIKALKGYKDGSYGGAMKAMMKGQVASLTDANIEAIAISVKSGTGVATDKATEHASAAAVAQSKVIDINKGVQNAPERIAKEDLGNKKVVTESTLGLRKDNLYKENNKELPVKTDYSRPAPGSSTKFERAYLNAPPMIPHSVDGLLPITQNNNQCLGCHMPDVSKGVGATAIPVSHFTNYRPKTELKDGKFVKEGKTVGMNGELGNVSDIKIAKAEKSDKLYQGRFNCTQCHAPQAKVDTDVANTFTPDFKGQDKMKAHSSLADAMNEGVE
jgi:cytochrome c-type protein NapB